MSKAFPPGSDAPLAAGGEISQLVQLRGFRTFAATVRHIQGLPYGRTSKMDYRLVLTEGRGTCSSKHALLAALAQENELAVKLTLGVYEMTETNTPGVGKVLASSGLSSIPEAHCFLRTAFSVIDVTMPGEALSAAERVFLHEEVIGPADVGAYKTSVHRRVLANWLYATGRSSFGLDAAWAVREACIAALSGEAPKPSSTLQAS
ncbi:hypothetical protein ACFQY5_40150 [Paeniroseomonas aquatica]|uniref:Uncharacterized protein n=1 Tax=Paeniroseomonas aquatica TaxID=373043 RepID=A0ABT8A0A3_9PROT|nr:hypothetical protein [Paeniroseomonas aquatica]MDN3563133.1 hypothetical protein [Paeniroseomonas aquatica]